MADLVTESIAQSKMKVRWEEPYVSEGINRQVSVLPKGVHRGGYLVPESPASTSVKIVPDDGSGLYSETAFMFKDTVNGFAIAILEDSEITLDLSAHMPVGAPVTWYVWAEAAYSVSSATTGNYHVSDTAPTGDYVLFGTIALTPSETVISATEITANPDRPVPLKSELGAYSSGDQEYGFLEGQEAWRVPTLDQKRAMNAAASPDASNEFMTADDWKNKPYAFPHRVNYNMGGPVTKFQLPGYYYVGFESEAESRKYFKLARFSVDTYELLVGGDNKPITVGAVWKDDDSGPIDPATDAPDGFYANPYIYFDLSYTTDTTVDGDIFFYCLVPRDYATWEENPYDATNLFRIFHNTLLHAQEIDAGDEGGSPSSFSGVGVQGALAALLGFINARVEKIDPSSGTDDWKLLWRSHNITSPASVTKDTISLYWSNKGVALVVGGYLKETAGDWEDIVAGTGDDTANVIMKVVYTDSSDAAAYSMVKDSPTAGTTWTWWSNASWDAFEEENPLGKNFWSNVWLQGSKLKISDNDSYIEGYYQTSPSTYKWLLLFDSLGGNNAVRTRIYYRGDEASSEAQHTLLFTYNAWWDDSTDTFKADIGHTDRNAYALGIGTDAGGIFFYKKDTSEISAGGWADNAWTAQMSWMTDPDEAEASATDVYPCAVVDGELYERFPFDYYFTAQEDMTANDAPVSQAMQYRNKYGQTGGPTTLTVDPTNPIGKFDVFATEHTHDSDDIKWGFQLQVYVEIGQTVTAGESIALEGRVHVYN